MINMDSWEALRKECSGCADCALQAARRNLVFGTGNESAEVMLIGEGPGEQEDIQGEPFVGPAGRLLDVMLELIDLDRSRVYIANTVKCRPPMNRDPADEERESCRKWLDRQISLVDPKIILCLGRIAAKDLIYPDFRITKEHGKWFDIGDRRVLATYHPSALLRDVSKRPDAFMDMRALRAEIKRICERTY